VGRHDRHPGRKFGPAQQTRVDHGLDNYGKRCLQSQHAERGLGKGMLLVVPCMRRMIGGNSVNGSVRQSFSKGLDMLMRPERRIHLVRRVIAEHLTRGKREVMGRDFRRHIDAALLRPANDIDGLSTGHVTDVQPGSRQLGDLDISRDNPGLGRGRPTGKS
jgi:hypothetical protein